MPRGSCGERWAKTARNPKNLTPRERRERQRREQNRSPAARKKRVMPQAVR